MRGIGLRVIDLTPVENEPPSPTLNAKTVFDMCHKIRLENIEVEKFCEDQFSICATIMHFEG